MNENNAEIQRSLGRIEGKLDALKDDISEIKDRIKTHDVRIRSIEKRNVFISSLTAGLTALGFEFKSKLGF